ncbi:MCE family protein [Intrasporangium calvum]|uniref:MCE family protein n=1 Tax=Intrasporangium calvum TaxID=53358 RepID=A0ABT5GJ22_9MICO|nr:MCE family protein [Intrasporangium calvum]MDC5698247.1 MCE family protein [Intrasporangium calvum]
MSAPQRSRRAIASAAVGAVLGLSGCSAADLPLPGGAGTGSDSYSVTVEFADVLDLVPQSSVKVNQVTVGTVEAIEVVGWSAVVRLRLPGSLELPDNAVAELQQTSLLGEKYVSLAAPTNEPSTGRLAEGDRIPLDRSARHPEVEEVLGAMSLLLNGGGVAQLKTIEAELNDAMRGRSDSFRSVVDELGTFIGGLDDQKADIVRAIDSLDGLAATLSENQDTIAAALDELPKGLKVLADQRKQLTAMLTALADLGEVGTRVIRASRDDLEANLAALTPILTRLNEAGDSLPQSYQLLLTYPFPAASGDAIKGDFANLWVTLDADVGTIAESMGVARLPGGADSWTSLFESEGSR